MPGQTGTEYKDFSIVLAIFTQACLLTCLPSIMPDKKSGVGLLPALTRLAPHFLRIYDAPKEIKKDVV